MFWDGSALVPVCLTDASSAETIRWFEEDPAPAIWWTTPVEAHSAITRVLRDRRIDRADATDALERLRQVRSLLEEVAPIDEIRTRAIRLLAAHRLRAADALQLAAALFWCEEQPSGETFVCLDKRLREAARQEGFTLLPLD